MRKVCLLGASGSIGTQTLDVMTNNPQDFTLVGFSVGSRINKVASILEKYPTVEHICVKDPNDAIKLQKEYPNIHFYSEDNGLLQLIENSDSDMVVNALVGFVGFVPTLYALKRNKIVCLANKESLVVGGEMVNELLEKGYGKLYPIDSEHVAIAKCLAVDDINVDKIILTASGGAFRYLTRDLLKDVAPSDALKHPTWKMGDKITIDCATMINKAFEMIEAHYLFGFSYPRILIQLHDESMIHSMVKYRDNTYRLDHGKPDMRVPIKWALYEGITDYQTILTADYTKIGKNYHFRDFSLERYPIVYWAKYVIERKGTYGACLNAANEIAVKAFLNKSIPFLAIESIVSKCMKEHVNIEHPVIEQIIECDYNTRLRAVELIEKGDY